jgi:hypothetical protein
MRMNPAEIAELQQLLEGIASMQQPADEGADAAADRAGGGGDDFRTRERTSEPEGGAVRQDPPAATLELDDYEELESEEIIALLGSMERRELEALRQLESGSRARPSVLQAIDSVLARVPAAG